MRIERRAVVHELARELREGSVVDRLLVRVITGRRRERLTQRGRRGRGGQLADAAQAVGRTAIERRLRIGVVEGVGGIVVAAAEDVATIRVGCGIAYPFAHV